MGLSTPWYPVFQRHETGNKCRKERGFQNGDMPAVPRPPVGHDLFSVLIGPNSWNLARATQTSFRSVMLVDQCLPSGQKTRKGTQNSFLAISDRSASLALILSANQEWSFCKAVNEIGAPRVIICCRFSGLFAEYLSGCINLIWSRTVPVWEEEKNEWLFFAITAWRQKMLGTRHLHTTWHVHPG